MITVEWYDFAGREHRRGQLLQISPGTGADLHTPFAFVITQARDSDEHYNKAIPSKVAGLPATCTNTIIIPVKLSYLRVLGTEIPLFSEPEAK